MSTCRLYFQTVKKNDEEKPQLTHEELEKLMGLQNKNSSKTTPPLQKQKTKGKSLLKKNIQKMENNNQDGHRKVTTISDDKLKEHKNENSKGTPAQIQKPTEIPKKILEDYKKTPALNDDIQIAGKNKGTFLK